MDKSKNEINKMDELLLEIASPFKINKLKLAIGDTALDLMLKGGFDKADVESFIKNIVEKRMRRVHF